MNCSRCKTYTANYTFNPKRTVSSPLISARVPGNVILIDMYIAQIQGDRLQGKFYLPGHQVQVVNVGRQSEVRIAAALVGGQNQFTTVQLELYQTQTGCLVALGTGFAQKKHVVLAVAPLPVNLRDQRRKFFEIRRVAVH